MKKIGQKLLSALLALCLALSCAVGAQAFPDTEGLAYEANIRALYEAGVITGRPDGTFRPDDALTYGEAAALLARAFMLKPTGKTEIDIPADHWAYAYIQACADAGVLDLVGNGPETAIPFRVFGDALALILGGFESEFTDAPRNRGYTAAVLDSALSVPFGERQVTGYGLLAAQRLLDTAAVLRPFTLAGYYEDNTVHAVALTDAPAAYVYDPAYRGFVPAEATAEHIVYSFVAVLDDDGDGMGDTLFIVRREDSETYWDADAYYSDPRGEDIPAYRGTYDNAYNIPAGERLMDFGIDGAMTDYYNLAAPGDLAASPYYYTYDWYSSTSTETLTLLTGFRTVQQSTGWSCGVTAALMAMDWFDARDGLNELDLGALRNTKEKFGTYRWGGATDTKMLISVFTALNEMAAEEIWGWESTYDFVDADGELSEDYLSPDRIQSTLSQGRPILVGWNSFGGHWQVIIGYDNLGTETTADDVLILADPYDTTDHRNDGVNVQSYERLYYDWTQDFDRDFGAEAGYGMPVLFAPYPIGYDAAAYAPVMGGGLAMTVPAPQRAQNQTEDMVLPYGETAADLAASAYGYAKAEAGDNGLAGAAGSDYYRMGEVPGSPYYPAPDFYTGAELPETLIVLEGFQTAQQASEWTCGPASLRLAANWFGILEGESEFALAALRERDIEGATLLDGMVQMLVALAPDFAYYTTDDLDDDGCIGGYCLYDGASDGGLIPYCLQNGVPIIIGWDEWGGHWQVIIGYDDMGTAATQDDVLILADPYDTTDHRQDGYVIESFERLVYGWGAAFDPRGGEVFLIAAPTAFLD